MNSSLSGLRIGFAVCGSFCTYQKVFPQLDRLQEMGAELIPLMSEVSYSTDTRFGRAQDFIQHMERVSGRDVLHTIAQAEPIGPKKLLDVLVIAPCTGNTLSKLARGIADSTVTLAAKAHLRNERPIVVAVSSNDALAGNAVSLGSLLARNHFYFVPFSQDDPLGKPCSLVANMEKIPDTILAALESRQLQPILD